MGEYQFDYSRFRSRNNKFEDFEMHYLHKKKIYRNYYFEIREKIQKLSIYSQNPGSQNIESS